MMAFWGVFGVFGLLFGSFGAWDVVSQAMGLAPLVYEVRLRFY